MNPCHRAWELIDGPLLIGAFLLFLVGMHLARPPLMLMVYAGLLFMALGAGLRSNLEHRLRRHVGPEELGESRRILRLHAGVLVASFVLSVSSAATMASITLLSFRPH